MGEPVQMCIRDRYTAPTFLVKVPSSDARLTEHIVLVSGGVAMKKNVWWRRGMTLLEAIVGAGDITDWGSRYVQVTRGGKTCLLYTSRCV